MSEIITAVITGVLSALFFFYVSFTIREKGPIFSNTFLLTPKEDWDKIDRKAEYRMVSIVFGIVAVLFAFLTIYIFTEIKLFLYLVLVLAAVDVIYAIVQSVK